MKTRKLIFLGLLTLSVSIYSCSNDSEDDFVPAITQSGDPDDPDNPTTTNYTDNVRPVMQSSCVGCHSSPPVNGAPFALVNYTQVNQRASSILSRMSLQSGAGGAMPPSGRLPQTTIDVIQQWITDGQLEN
jgi:hypothetical protein